MTRELDLHVVLQIDDEDTATDAEIAAEVRQQLSRVGFAVIDVEDLPANVRVIVP